MALMDENGTGTTMLVQPAGGFGNNGGNGFMDGSGWWILLLFILLGGWGNNNGIGGGFGGGMGGGNLYPWMNQSNQINDGFQNQLMNDNITSIRDGVFGISTQLCNSFAGVAQQLSTNQMADMERSFAVQSALQNCCCENQKGIESLRYTVATENCADRTQSLMNTRDIIDSQTRGTQAILDKLCALELDGVKGQLAAAQRENVGLQNQINMANLAASQAAQTAQVVDNIYNRLSTGPVGTVPVYGEQPIFTCNNNNGCGCGNSF